MQVVHCFVFAIISHKMREHLRKVLAVLLVIPLCFVAVAASTPAQANNTTLPPTTLVPPSPKATLWGPNYDQDQISAYQKAVAGDSCATPSLECLVHQVSRFVAIEWVNSIVYPDGGFPAGEAPPPGADAGETAPSRKGLVQGVGTLIGLMYATPAASTPVFIADLLESAKITPTAYAQGLGFASLNPILNLWKAFRNIAYMFFVIIILVIGFMIMFRQKVGSQTAVTAQQAIPSVVVSLILVTFSFAIAGFMIDLMYLSMFLIIGIFGQDIPGNLIDKNILGLIGELATSGVLNGFQNINLVTNLFDSLVSSELNGVIGAIGGLTLTVVLAVAILIGTIRLFFELLKSYASIVISVVTSPITLMMGAFPGNNQFGPWIRDLFGNLLPFPLILLVLVLFYQFQAIPVDSAGVQGGFMPPFLLGRGQAGAISSLLGLAIILALPTIVQDAKKRFVKEGYGMVIAKGAGDALKSGWEGGKPIDGVPFKIPGIKQGRDLAVSGAKRGGTEAVNMFNRWRVNRENKAVVQTPNIDTSQHRKQIEKPSIPRPTRRIP